MLWNLVLFDALLLLFCLLNLDKFIHHAKQNRLVCYHSSLDLVLSRSIHSLNELDHIAALCVCFYHRVYVARLLKTKVETRLSTVNIRLVVERSTWNCYVANKSKVSNFLLYLVLVLIDSELFNKSQTRDAVFVPTPTPLYSDCAPDLHLLLDVFGLASHELLVNIDKDLFYLHLLSPAMLYLPCPP